MLFRTSEGKLIEIKKCDFKNDTLYYQKLLDIKKPIPKLEKCFNYKNYKQSDK
jgi:hypothetical protein